MLRRLSLTAALLAGTVVAAVLPGAPAQARACTIQNYCYTTWYTSAAKTTVAGELYEDCNGNRTIWGTRTAYVTFVENPC